MTDGLATDRGQESPEAIRAPLAAWLARRLGEEAVTVDELRRPRGGYSAETWICDATVGGVPERFVLRRERPEPPIYPTQVPGLVTEVLIQYRVMEAVGGHAAAPVAPLIGYEEDLGVLGQPFFVMRFVAGDIPAESPPYTKEGFFATATPAERRGMLTAGLATLAGLHAMDWRAAGLDWLVAPGTEPGAEQQLAVWEAYGDAVLDGRHHPVIAEGLRWLHAHPPRGGPPVFNWGDARPGNIIFSGAAPVCITDFENAAIAPPEMDLGWWLNFDRTMHEGVGRPERAEGDLTRAEQVEVYARAAGRDPEDLRWFEIFAAVRYSLIVVRVLNRSVARGRRSPDDQGWLHNSIVDGLARLLDGEP